MKFMSLAGGRASACAAELRHQFGRFRLPQLRAGRFRLLLLPGAIGLCASLAACSHGPRTAALVASVHPQIAHIRQTHQLDASARKYIQQLENAGTFRARARLQPLMDAAVQSGAATRAQAIAEFAKMRDKSPTSDERHYWMGRIARDAAAPPASGTP